MQVFDQEIYDIVEKGLEGNGLSAENVLALYEVEETSKEAAYIRWAGQELSMIAADGVAEELQVLLVPCLQQRAQGQVRAAEGGRAGVREALR